MRTLIVSQTIGYALCTAVMALLWLQHRHRFQGLGFWLADFSMQMLALLFFALRGTTITTELSIMAGNALIVGGTILFCVGLERFLERQCNPIPGVALMVVFLIIHACFTFIKPDLAARNINNATALLIVFVQCIWVIARHDAEATSISRWGTVIFVGFCMVSVVRIINNLILWPQGDFLADQGTLEFLTNLSYQALVFASLFLIFMLINRRLVLENATQQKALQSSEMRYRQLVELSPEAIVVYQRGIIVFANSAAAQLLKAGTSEELLGKPALGFVHPDDRPLAEARIAEALASGQPAPLLEERLICLDGTLVDVEVTTSRLDYQGQPTLQTIGRNITHRKQIEAQLQVYQQRLETQNLELRKLSRAIEQSASTIVITDLGGSIEYVNPAFTRITGYTAEEAIGQNPRILKSGLHGPELYQDLWTTIRRGDTWQGEIINRKRDGSFYYEAATISPVRDQSGHTTHYIAVKDDITERKRAEEALRESEEALRHYAEQLAAQNAELDAFAHTVAHDLKNPIGLILGYSDLLRDDAIPLSAEQQQSAIRVIAQTGRKLNTIIEELMLLSGLRKQTITPGPIDMPKLIQEAQQRLLDQIAQRKATVAVHDDLAWPVALGYAPWVEEVWANYISNALKYGGRPELDIAPHVEIGWNWVEVEDRLATSATSSPRFVRFWVRDNGPGISAEAQAKLFVPFTRLDQVRIQGHGLGLSIVQRIIERLGGQVGVESTPGEGSTFYFVLPATTEPVDGCTITKAKDDEEKRPQDPPPSLQGLPQDWIHALQRAAIECDFAAIQTLSAHIQLEWPEVAGFVNAKAEAFAYDALLEWMNAERV